MARRPFEGAGVAPADPPLDLQPPPGPPPGEADDLDDDETDVLDPGPSQDDAPPAPMASSEDRWTLMDTAPLNRPIFLTADPEADAGGILCIWRTTRVKTLGRRGWQPRSFWATLLNKREIEFDPFAWREAMPQPAENAA